jgi:hypothetical protein
MKTLDVKFLHLHPSKNWKVRVPVLLRAAKRILRFLQQRRAMPEWALW